MSYIIRRVIHSVVLLFALVSFVFVVAASSAIRP